LLELRQAHDAIAPKHPKPKFLLWDIRPLLVCMQQFEPLVKQDVVASSFQVHGQQELPTA
jgi:hypothetical protein